MNTIISLFTVIAVLFCSGYAVKDGYTNQTSGGECLKAALSKDYRSGEYTGEASGEVWSASDEYTADCAAVIYKNPGEDLSVLTVDDIHLSDDGYRVFFSIFAEATLKRLVAETAPDLILLPGDIVCGDRDEYSIRRLTDLMESFGVPWAPVFGNHDDEANCDLNYLADIMMKGPHCLFRKGDARMGCGNYVIHIVEKSDAGEKLVGAFVMADSHHSQVNELQQQWYAWVCEGISHLSGGKAEVSLVQHIPLPEYQYAYDKYGKTDAFSGELHEKICCERDADGNPVQRGFFDVIKKTGNTKFVFCAHEHMNDFSVEYEGVRLTYLMKLGKNSGYQPGFDGGSLITFGDGGIKTISHLTKSVTGFCAAETISVNQ